MPALARLAINGILTLIPATAILLHLMSLVLTHSVSAVQLSISPVQPEKLVLMEKVVNVLKDIIGILEKLIVFVMRVKIISWILMGTVKSAIMFQ